MATTKPKKPDLNEIATIHRDITRITFGGVLQNQDDTLLTRGRGKGLKIYDELERDCHAGAVLDKRKMAIVAREWDVAPASEDALDVQAAEMVRDAIKGIEFDRICKELLDATLKGFAVGEVMWKIADNLLLPADIIPRDQRRFVFDEERTLRLLTTQNLMNGEELPERKFIVHRFGAKDGSPYGLGLGHRLFWPVFFKRQDITFWLTFADKFGSPTAKGTYPRGATEAEKKKVLEALKAIAQEAAIAVPEGTVIELLEAARAGSIDTYEKLARYMDEQMSEAVLGETMTTTAKAAGLGSNQADVHNEVRVELAKGDADLLSDTLNKTLVTWIVELNLPNARLPKLWRNFDEAEDINARATRDKNIYDMGFQPTEKYILDTYGEGWVPREIAPAVPGFPAFAEGVQAKQNHADQQALVDAAATLSEEWQKLIGSRVEDLLTMLDETQDLKLFRERLDEILTSEPPPELVEALARAGFGAALIGRAAKP